MPRSATRDRGFFCWTGQAHAMHTIRLHGPWQKRIDDQSSLRVHVPELDSDHPADELAPQTVSYQRRFNLPTGLEPDNRVLLTVSGWIGRLQSLRLNEQPLPADQGLLEVDITRWLRPHNRLELVLASDAGQPPRLSGEVALLIDAAD
jgi:hypothetical protein